ncbi:ABC transporter substrate-binding protein [Georgenia sp. EYE_87]|uniref:ABC transporter substrate-binding protein n=1 Tax=Georgenia sp. EYE_87 TaxID=2853448 RepID=UPI0020065B9C|nr:ABC transporter substrate-binding protein [Georgenia sp. EYE_87]MCK6212105.1 ABC transporter substrate-binding protein [Georgenia sp. EYE_87]
MSTKKRTLATLAGITAAALTFAGCSASSSSPSDQASTADDQASAEVAELAVGITPIANAAHVYIALDQGFFADENLEVSPTIIQTPTTAVPSLLNDELQVALMTSVPIVTAASKSLPIRVVAGSDRYPTDGAQDTTALVAAPDSGVSAVADLTGKTVALVGLKSAPELALRVVLQEAGVNPADVEVVEIAYPDMVSALQSNRVDAAFIVDPFLSAAQADGLEVVSKPFTEGLGGMSALQWVMSDAFVKANPEVAARFAAAIQRAGEYANDNPDAVRAVLPEFTALSPEAIEASILPVYDTTVTDADLQAYVDLMIREGFIEDGYDPAGLLWTSSGD